MITNGVSSEDAILVYLIAIAYLHETEISGQKEAHAWRAKEMWRGVFYIWPRTPYADRGDTVPTAMCTYKKVQSQWKVAVRSGERLTLYDSGPVWDIAEDAEKQVTTKKAKRYSRGRTQKRR